MAGAAGTHAALPVVVQTAAGVSGAALSGAVMVVLAGRVPVTVGAGVRGAGGEAPVASWALSAEGWGWLVGGAAWSKKRSSSTGTGMTRVLFFSSRDLDYGLQQP
jgi:hypothetical protein